MKDYINWKIFFILLSLASLSVICVFPYILTVQGELIRGIGQPVEIIFIAQFIQSLILFSIAIFLGLSFAKKINFRLPLIEAIVEKRNYDEILKDTLGKSILIGAATAVAIYTLDALFTIQGAAISTHQSYAPVWQKLLASFYGGITEEILMRLFLMTFFIWIGMKIFRQKQPTRTEIMISILLAAIIFGLGHLPITASLTALTPLIIARAVVLNGVGGIIFGWLLFWKKGLESAMIAHFTTDIFLLTLLPLLFN
jgi:membrane protease YdiL (CAAX protease family)